jgi:hypothetical protein
MGCNHLAHRAGDAINVMLAAVGHNIRILLWRLSLLLRAILAPRMASPVFKPPKIEKFTDDEFDGQRDEVEGVGRVATNGWRK